MQMVRVNDGFIEVHFLRAFDAKQQRLIVGCKRGIELVAASLQDTEVEPAIRQVRKLPQHDFISDDGIVDLARLIQLHRGVDESFDFLGVDHGRELYAAGRAQFLPWPRASQASVRATALSLMFW